MKLKATMITLTAALGLTISAARAGDFQITPDLRDPSWSIHQAYALKDTAGNVIASWSKPNSTTWSFHDPYNKISVHVGASGTVTDWTFN